MEHSTSRSKRIQHVLALLCSTGFLVVVPVALYAGLIVWSGDLGGPLNLVIVPVASASIGVAISLAVFLPLSLLAERLGLRRWLQVVGGLSGVLAVVVALAWIFVAAIRPENRVFLVAVSVCLYFAAGFFVHLCCLVVCHRVWPTQS
jgi:hypothetical protein